MLEFVLNFLFPPVCGICGKINKEWLCTNCEKRLERYQKEKYIQNFNNNKLKNYEENRYFDELFYIFEYKNLIRKLLLQYKFSDKSYLDNFWVNVILKSKKLNEMFKNYDIMIPVPMEKNKEQIRGYNQTKLITDIIYKLNKINVFNNILIKTKKTQTQSTLSLEKRYQNIENAFEVKNEQLIKNKKIIIFDDIYTTGATINECIEILKKAKVKKIFVLILAKD